MKKIIGAQGEITIIQHIGATAFPEGFSGRPVQRVGAGWIISHSESGNHHVLTGGEVMERTDKVPAGMQVLYALLDEPASLEQDAQVPHGKFDLPAGLYEFRISREFDPFAQQARRVAD